jgi:hypothetical protein
LAWSRHEAGGKSKSGIFEVCDSLRQVILQEDRHVTVIRDIVTQGQAFGQFASEDA